MKTLIIKCGAFGDVVRTTVLLRELEGEIFWLTKQNAKDLLKSDKLTKTFFMERADDLRILKGIKFDFTISLEENKKALEVLKTIKTKKIVGTFLNERNEVNYSPEANILYNMSLISKLKKEEADELKNKNKRSIPEILINMIGKEFKAQEYDLNVLSRRVEGKIGLIDISAGIWPNKYWRGYEELGALLRTNGYPVSFLRMRNTLNNHIEDINNCEVIVCGDTLGMHVALALEKKVVALFNCTPFNEIYDYGRLTKIISPLYDKYFFSKDFSEEAINAIPVSHVYKAIERILGRKNIEKK